MTGPIIGGTYGFEFYSSDVAIDCPFCSVHVPKATTHVCGGIPLGVVEPVVITLATKVKKSASATPEGPK